MIKLKINFIATLNFYDQTGVWQNINRL